MTRKITSEDMALVKMQQVPMVAHSTEGFQLQIKLTGIQREDGNIIVFTQPTSPMLQKLWADQLKGKIIVLDYVADYSPVKEEEEDGSE